jgi:galactokinase
MVVASAPGRVNLIGEHVDYAEGLVLPMAIDRRTAVSMAWADRESSIASEGLPGVWRGSLAGAIDPIRQPSSTGEPDWHWVNYVLGPLAELRRVGIPLAEIDCTIASDVPLGGGVSSSAALEVAVATALLGLTGRSLDHLTLARLCQSAEHRFAGTPCGIMDMTVSAGARAGHALLIDCRTLELRHVPMPGAASIIVFDSGVRHRLSDGGYASRRSAVEGAARALGVPALRDATLDAVNRAQLEPAVRRRARHVVSEIARTAEAAEALAEGNLSRCGALMRASHVSLRDDFEVSVPELDAIVDAANAVQGTHGARLTGGGFGGCAVALVESQACPTVIAAVGRECLERFGREPAWFVTTASDGARIEYRA